MSWQQISCAAREVRPSENFAVSEGFTDMDGEHGEPYILREWCDTDGRPVFRDERWPKSDRLCEHYIWKAE